MSREIGESRKPHVSLPLTSSSAPLNVPLPRQEEPVANERDESSNDRDYRSARVEYSKRPTLSRLRRNAERATSQHADDNDVDDAAASAAFAFQETRSAPSLSPPTISLQSVVQSLTLNDVRLSIVDIVKYGVFTLMVLVMLLYLFPQQILLIMMLVLFVLFLILYIAIQRINIKNRRIDLTKLEHLRRLKREATTTRYDN